MIDALLLSAGHAGLLRDAGALGGFYDVQGHAFLHGHLDVDPAAVSIEGFRIDGRTYIYFGPVPSLLRLPVLALTHDLDRRLTQLSMLTALVVLLWAAARLQWQVRELVRPGAALERGELAAVALLQVAIGAGSVVLFITAWLSVYNETELWGAALALAALSAVVVVLSRPGAGAVAAAALLSLLAVHARVSVGLGPVIALGIVFVGLAAQTIGRRGLLGAPAVLGPLRAPVRPGRTLALLGVAAVLPVASYMALNEAKFHQLAGLPFEYQANTQLSPIQQRALAANGGSLFGAKFVPTTTLQAVRPDALGLARGFPFLSLPRDPPRLLGNVVLIEAQRSLSIPTSMTLLGALALLGLAAVARRPRLRALAGPLAGTLAAFVPALAIAFVTTRYMADLLPFLVLAALIGLQTLLGATSGHGRGRLIAALAIGALVGIVVNGAVGLMVQRLIGAASEQQRASFVATQDDVDRALGRSPHGIRVGPELPEPAEGRPGDLFVVDRCAALYALGQDDSWVPVERTARGGLHRLRVVFPATTAGGDQALLRLGSGSRAVVLAARARGEGVSLSLREGRRVIARGPSNALVIGRPATVQLSFDNTYKAFLAAVTINGRSQLTASVPFERAAVARLGSAAAGEGLAGFSGSVTPLANDAPVCRKVARRAGLPVADG